MEREHKPEGTRWIFPTGSVRKSCNEKRRSQPSEFTTALNYRNEKYEYEWKHGKNLYDSCAQDYSSLENQRLSLEKNHGQPFQKACSKSCGSSSALGGKRIKLRPQWPGVLQRRPRTHASPIHFSRKVIA